MFLTDILLCQNARKNIDRAVTGKIKKQTEGWYTVRLKIMF